MLQSALQLTGIGLRSPHYSAFLERRPHVAWVEVHSENYFGEGGRALHYLEKIREHYPVSLHGVGLSLGSADELNWQHLKQLKDLMGRINPCLISDHLSWSSIHGQYLHDLLPLPYTEEALEHIVTRIQQVQDYLQKQILIENISHYVRFEQATMCEQDFFVAAVQRSGCGILLDVNNVYVNASNFGTDPMAFISALPGHLVQEIHVAGFTTAVINKKEILIDSHNRPIVPAVWDLYQQTIQLIGRKPTIIEWDTDIPTLDTLCLEAYRAEKIMRETYATAKRTG